MNEQKVLHSPFNIEIHKQTFVNYLEVIIDEEGTIMYAIPSHQEKLINIACDKLEITRDELYKRCPEEYYFDLMEWLCKLTGCIALWNERKVGAPNDKQTIALNRLSEEGLYQESIK